jgi:hypothetical protein
VVSIKSPISINNKFLAFKSEKIFLSTVGNMQVQCKGISLHKVQAKASNYNVCNLWEFDAPADYPARLQEVFTHNWINSLHPEGYKTLEIPAKYYSLLTDAFRIGNITGCVPGVYASDLHELAQHLATAHAHLFENGQHYFVRGEATSLKTGMHGVGPYANFMTILESIVTCTAQHNVFNHVSARTKRLTLYFLPWNADLDPDLEFRAFVVHGQLTALSQQSWFRHSPKLQALLQHSNVIHDWVEMLQRALATTVSSICEQLPQFVMDVAFIPDGENWTMFLIELNPFGAAYSSGSALFHWKRHAALLNDATFCDVRFVQA